MCSANTEVRFVAENLSTMQSGTPVDFTLAAGNNTVPALAACVNSIEQFINYTVNGTPYNLSYPTDSLTYFVNTQATPPIGYIYGGAMNGTTDGYVGISFVEDGTITPGSALPLLNFSASQIQDSTSLNNAAFVNITEYGNPGEFVAGNFECTLTGSNAATYAVIGSFRVRRR
jgi:hypothetical protein